MTKIWMVRAGQGGSYVDDFVENNLEIKGDEETLIPPSPFLLKEIIHTKSACLATLEKFYKPMGKPKNKT